MLSMIDDRAHEKNQESERDSEKPHLDPSPASGPPGDEQEPDGEGKIPERADRSARSTGDDFATGTTGGMRAHV